MTWIRKKQYLKFNLLILLSLRQSKEETLTTEAFLLTIKTASNIDELEAMINIVDHEIYKQRSRDTNRLVKDGEGKILCHQVRFQTT